jgi:hypothetical protein
MPNTLGLHRLHCLHRAHLLTYWALFAALSLGACDGGGTVSGLPSRRTSGPLWHLRIAILQRLWFQPLRTKRAIGRLAHTLGQ